MPPLSVADKTIKRPAVKVYSHKASILRYRYLDPPDSVPESVCSALQAGGREGYRTVGASGASWAGGGRVALIERSGSNVVSGDKVALSTSSNAVDWSMVLMDQTISLEFLIKGEHCSLSSRMNVSGTTTATEEEFGGGGWNLDRG